MICALKEVTVAQTDEYELKKGKSKREHLASLCYWKGTKGRQRNNGNQVTNIRYITSIVMVRPVWVSV